MSGITFLLLVAAAAVAWIWWTRRAKRQLRARIELAGRNLAESVRIRFQVDSCSKCFEVTMTLLSVSPNSRSVHYGCRNCGKETWAPAATPEAATTAQEWVELHLLLNEWNRKYPPWGPVWFVTTAAPLPYQTTARLSISGALRSEIWRRDQGQCAVCAGNQNLEFDHIIPVSRGGATSASNLQLLCRSCNRTKAAKI